MKSAQIYPTHVQKISLKKATTISRMVTLVVIGLIFIFALPFEAFAITPIAHTDVVPYQRIDHGTSFNFGVVAFSKPGINRVRYAISGQGYSGGAKASNSMALNTRVASAEYNGVWEYFVAISASEFTGNGPITVTPTVYDNDGNTRTLQPVTLIVEGASANFSQREAWVDPSRSDGIGTVGNRNDPFPNIQAAVSAAQSANGGTSSGNIIYLEEGTHSISGLSASTPGEWLTITKAAGTNRNNVIINKGRPSVSRLKIDNITLQSQGGSQEVLYTNSAMYWTNSCRRIGSGRSTLRSNPVFVNLQNVSSNGKYYSTDDYTYNVNYGYRQAAPLIRGAVVERTEHDVFPNYVCVINAKVKNITNGNTINHTDVLQVYQDDASMIPVSNRLAYNIYATDVHYQGIMRSSLYQTPRDNAYINVFIEMRNPGEAGTVGGYRHIASGLSTTPDDHLLVWHCSFPYAHGTWGNSTTNSSFVGNLFWQDHSDPSQKGTTEWLYNHFMYVYNVTDSCIGTTRFADSGWPCPQWNASIKDSGSSTASYGGGVVDISTPGASDFGYPKPGSPLINALSSKYVPCDALGNPRDSRPDIGALEYQGGSSTPPPGGGGSTVVNPTGLEVVDQPPSL